MELWSDAAVQRCSGASVWRGGGGDGSGSGRRPNTQREERIGQVRAGLDRSGQIRAGQATVVRGGRWEERRSSSGTHAGTWSWSPVEHGPARRSSWEEQLGTGRTRLAAVGENLQQAIRATFLARGRWGWPSLCRRTRPPAPSSAFPAPGSNPPAPTDLMPAGLESVQQPCGQPAPTPVALAGPGWRSCSVGCSHKASQPRRNLSNWASGVAILRQNPVIASRISPDRAQSATCAHPLPGHGQGLSTTTRRHRLSKEPLSSRLCHLTHGTAAVSRMQAWLHAPKTQRLPVPRMQLAYAYACDKTPAMASSAIVNLGLHLESWERPSST
ncbi:hypothetical protein AOQ84DRAFT_438949 [Glonium stellatum]|uniref:Uncharacterized protein n=1 Tax=Glonium stellatum TaxID=574774 RepID=A0A8E2JTW2_9PEZI|nr:hypothetical protein AOQ84DRAFT_438949 [Glonium stellatum]